MTARTYCVVRDREKDVHQKMDEERAAYLLRGSLGPSPTADSLMAKRTCRRRELVELAAESAEAAEHPEDS